MNNDAPEKIYLSPSELAGIDYDEEWYDRPFGDSIEYIRSDAFIEKACSWLKNHYRDYMYNPTGKRLEAFFGGNMCNDFEDYMKGE